MGRCAEFQSTEYYYSAPIPLGTRISVLAGVALPCPNSRTSCCTVCRQAAEGSGQPVLFSFLFLPFLFFCPSVCLSGRLRAYD